MVAALAAAPITAIQAATSDAAGIAQGLAEFRQGRFAEAFQAWEQAAVAGDPRGDLYLGVLYDSGQGVRQDYAQAIIWYRRAAEAGSAAGAFNVGVLYDAGLGVAKDPQQAAAWYARAAERRFGRAEYNLAMLNETGTGVKQNRQRAVDLYRRAADHGITAAQSHLAELGEHYVGTASNPQDAALQDFEQAQKLILSRSPAELMRAAALFRHSADQHNPRAEYDLGFCYEHGMGVRYDDAQALIWYRRASTDTTEVSLRSIAGSAADYLGRKMKREDPRNWK